MYQVDLISVLMNTAYEIANISIIAAVKKVRCGHTRRRLWSTGKGFATIPITLSPEKIKIIKSED